MLLEIGKRGGQAEEEAFLKEHLKTMPRTMLRYANERYPEPLRKRTWECARGGKRNMLSGKLLFSLLLLTLFQEGR